MAATCMAVCKGSRKKIRGIFISSCHLPVAVECDIVILSEPGPIPQAPVGQFCRHNLSPRGDGNVGEGGCFISPLDTTYPREGTETHCHRGGSQSKVGHNLSPRGDGNKSWMGPAVGNQDTTYPREGTETLPGCHSCSRAIDTTYPREGTETRYSGRVTTHEHDTTYPREGTETTTSTLVRMSSLGHNLSPRGDGNLLRVVCHTDLLRHNLSPRGDGNSHASSSGIS